MSTIISIHARQILDSRGNPTIEVDVVTDNGVLAGQQFLPEHLPGFMKQLNCATEIRNFIWEKVF